MRMFLLNIGCAYFQSVVDSGACPRPCGSAHSLSMTRP